MTIATAGPQPFIDDARARRNAVVLAIGHALYSCSAINIIVTAGLVGTMLAPDKALATLPISTFVIGTALSTIPVSLLMRRIGRRPGFMIGATAGLISALVCLWAIFEQSFALFCIGTMGNGIYQACAAYYRFAAADTASTGFKPKAISWVLLGGIAGAVFGPLIIIHSRTWFEPVLFAGNYLAAAMLCIAALAVLMFVDIPHGRSEETTGKSRPLGQILAQPRLIVAILCGMMAYGVMNLLMTATPIAMALCGFTVDDSAWVIQWHVLAMFVPSFFTGSLIVRFGAGRIMLSGMIALILAAVVGFSDITFGHFAVGLVLLGLGWNFGYIGGTAMVTDCYLPAEKNKVQAVNDFAVFATVAVSSLTSGLLLDSIGWHAVNLAALPMIAVCLAGLLWLEARRRREMSTA